MKYLAILFILAATMEASAITTRNYQRARLDDVNPSQTSTTSYRSKLQNRSFFQLAPVIGVTASTVSGFKNSDGSNGNPGYRSGYLAGAQALVGSGDLQFESGLYYAERGYAAKVEFYNGDSKTGSFETDVNLKYTELPLLARYNLSRTESSRFFVNGGVVLAQLQQVESSYSGSNGIGGSSKGTPVDVGYHNSDVRLAGGLGGMASLADSLSWTFGGDYQYSLAKINKGEQELHNSSLALNTGILFFF